MDVGNEKGRVFQKDCGKVPWFRAGTGFPFAGVWEAQLGECREVHLRR